MAIAFPRDSVGAEGRPRVWRVYADGRRELRQELKNVVVNDGLAMLENNLMQSGAVVDYFAWGQSGVDVNGSVVDKQPSSSGLTAQNGAGSIESFLIAGNVLTVYATIPSTDGNTPGSITEFGLAQSGTSLVSRFFSLQSFAAETKDATFALQFEYPITLSQV